MPYQPLESYRNSSDPSKDVLIVWNGFEALVLRSLDIPTEYYINPSGPQLGLGNTAPVLIEEWIHAGRYEHLIERAALSSLEVPNT